jgi:hypothetical protein
MLINFAVTRFARFRLINALRRTSGLLKSTLHGYCRELKACDLQSENVFEDYMY